MTASPSLQERNKALVREVTEKFLGRRDPSAVDRYFSPKYIQHNPQAAPGPEGVKAFFAQLFQALPDLRIEVDHLYAEGDRVFSFMRWHGTHRGPLFGFPPSNKEIVIRTAEIFRIENGLMAEHWDVVDPSDLVAKATGQG